MHIADVTLFFAPHSGGVKRYLLAKHRHFSRQSATRHSLIVPGARDAEVAHGVFEMKSPRVPYSGGYRVPLFPHRWRKLLNRLAPDIIEAGDPYHLAWTVLGAARDLGIPAVAFAHSDFSRMLASHVSPIAGWMADAYLRRLYARFDVVMAPSRSTAERLKQRGVTNVLIQPLGVDGDIFHPGARDPHLRAELDLASDVRLLVFAGRMAREKQIPLLVESLANLGDSYHLLLIGGECRERLASNVTVLPYEQESSHLARLLASADALVHAGAHETFGLIVLEAMACGIPVVGVRSGALTELIDGDVGILAERIDAISFTAAIQRLFSCDRAAMGLRAREKVENAYTWKSTFARQAERYSRLTRREGGADCAEADAARAQ
ncbi:MAG TPA: glycosyltransferase family 1 protein [Rudaea sp.]|jgi:alpha-1,6-mannosyltransferase|nr:glycosyltransferase family 1 protein [Rudaea sp.]